MKILEIKSKARKPNMGFIRGTPSTYYVLSQTEACNGKPIFLLYLQYPREWNKKEVHQENVG